MKTVKHDLMAEVINAWVFISVHVSLWRMSILLCFMWPDNFYDISFYPLCLIFWKSLRWCHVTSWASWHLKFEGGHLMSGEFPSQIASNAESISIWYHHYEYVLTNQYQPGSLGILIQQRQMRINPSYHPIKLTPQMIAYNLSNKNSKPHIVILLWDESSQHRVDNEVRVLMGYLRYETQNVTATSAQNIVMPLLGYSYNFINNSIGYQYTIRLMTTKWQGP